MFSLVGAVQGNKVSKTCTFMGTSFKLIVYWGSMQAQLIFVTNSKPFLFCSSEKSHRQAGLAPMPKRTPLSKIYSGHVMLKYQSTPKCQIHHSKYQVPNMPSQIPNTPPKIHHPQHEITHSKYTIRNIKYSISIPNMPSQLITKFNIPSFTWNN